MHFTIKPEDLASASAFVAPHLIKDPGEQPILACVHVDAADGHVTLTATGAVETATMTVPAGITEPGTALLPGRLLAELTAKLPDNRGDAEMRTEPEGTGCALTCGPFAPVLRMFAGGSGIDAYPVIRPATEVIGKVGAGDLAAAMNRASGFSKPGDIRFGGIELMPGENGIRLCAANGYQLADVLLPWSGEHADWDGDRDPILVSHRAVAMLARSLPDEGDVSVAVATRDEPDPHDAAQVVRNPVLLTLLTSDRSLTCELIAGRMFARGRHSRQLIPANIAEMPVTAQVRTADLADALARVSLVAAADPNVPVELALAAEDELCLRVVTEFPLAVRPMEHDAADAVDAEAVKGVGETVQMTPALLRNVLQAASGTKTVTLGLGPITQYGSRYMFVRPAWAEGDPCPASYMLVSRGVPVAQAAA